MIADLSADGSGVRPDYAGGGIVNLMSSIILALGGRADYPALTRLPVAELRGARNLILFIIDGLGAHWLQRRSPTGLLSRADRGPISSVFPPTTAAAITSVLTGTAPLQHGLTGWHLYLRELGCVMSVLPGVPRCGGVSYQAAGVDPAALFRCPSLFDRIDAAGVSVSPRSIAHSDFNRAHQGRSQVRPYWGLTDLFRQTLRLLKPGLWRRQRPAARRYFYLYWPLLDSIGHQQGMESAAAAAHLAEIESALARFIAAAAGTDTVLIVSADHGQIDSSPADVIRLADYPELQDALILPLCGEPRAAYCYLRDGRRKTFEAACGRLLADRVQVVPSQGLIDAGFFGTGRPHPRFAERVGDLCLLPRGKTVIRDTLLNETAHAEAGVHGGLSSAELLVPLAVFHL